ncbi:MAG: hypothetical protein UR52_C0008G0033 [Candidatus Gottesmanbacteria bacterium GW2011_GWA1_34_13]|uniref:Uncharacterized protein n=1 Tax=Candidatus Gottesmanbacteria bacterium GW2011_GWA1_34_13 TaxID=1618434 RepID=A0A0G0AQR0_9BACT|nr:MAG: hypothetical protein UR52_C0008G0033 [Candidatus Gottesmanbacteria bacterium GW2011_GWA1_34_13]
MTKYQALFQEMLRENEILLKKFRNIHDKYVEHPEIWQTEFNAIGSEVVDLIRIYEKKLCGKSESGQYGKFSGGLSDKFWGAIRLIFPKIDFVGVRIS